MQKNTVTIQEPPLQELNKKRSCLKRTCFTGCGCIVIFLIASLLLLKFATGPKTKKLKEIPPTILEHILPYDTDSIDTIQIISGRDRNKGIEMIAYIPKIILAPIFIAIEDNTPVDSKEKTAWSKFSTFVQAPLTDQRDSVMIEWSMLIAEPSFVYDYYSGELTKKGFTIENEQATNNIKQLYFKNKIIDGSLRIQDNPKKPGTDYVLLTFFTP
jgi:hypothetical protein